MLAGFDRAGELAAIHAEAFERSWDRATFEDLLRASGVFAVTDPQSQGFILIRVAADEGEVLTLAVIPAARRRGVGRRLVDQAAKMAASRGVASLFLEVAADNDTALGLYRAAGFNAVGRRAGYYARSAGPSVDALLLKKPLSPPA